MLVLLVFAWKRPAVGFAALFYADWQWLKP
jgi:hypothetical protein